MTRSLGVFAWVTACIALSAAAASAQQAEPVAAGAPAGYELALSGTTTVERGHAVRLFGIAYEVQGLSRLDPRADLVIDAEITARVGAEQARRVLGRANAVTGAGGRFELTIAVPTEAASAPALELVVHRASQPGRRFSFPLSTVLDEALDLLTDRNRYEPGERVRTWARVRSTRSQAPRSARTLRLTLVDASGRELAQHEARTPASGVVTAELTLPATAEAGSYRVLAQVLGAPPGARAERSIQVWRRTVERLLAEVELMGADADGVSLVTPGGRLRGRVWARTPSGTPVRGASVELRVREDAEPTRLTTGDDGAAPFDVRAPTFLSGDVGRETLSARVLHPAHGTVIASSGYLMARVRAVVDATPRGGALVPEVPSTVYLGVSDPRGRPLRAGTVVAVRGEGIARGQEAIIDARGFAEVPITLPRGAASTLRTGPCAGQVATTLEVEVRIDPPVVARVCARVSHEAEVSPRLAGSPIVPPGQSVDVEIARRPGASARPVLVEALWNGRAVAFAWAAPREARVQLTLPDDLLGVVTLRARAAREPDAREPSTEPGASGFGRGAFDALLVRPADSFALEVAPERERYLVRERAEVRLAASRPPAGPSWGALVVRDEAAHGGEGPWELHFLRDELHEAAWQPASEANARLVRAALAAQLGIDPEPPAAPPLEAPYWEPQQHRPPYHPGLDVGRGVLRNPVAIREELLRRGLAPIEQALERAVAQLGPDASGRDRLVDTRGGRAAFHPDAVAQLLAARQLADTSARTLGGEPVTVAMIEAADPGFSFDTVSRRVARGRLARLLLALSRLSNPDDPNAQRVSSQLPPERWLGTLVQLSMVQARDLVDPWGRAFVFRRVTGRRPRVAVSERALDWELASPGPDGRIGTADDLADPFARAVPEGTPYAVTSGEEALLRRFSVLAPAQQVLTRMSQAYDRVALAATEEQRASVVTASSSEALDEEVAVAAELEASADDGMMGLGSVGYGRGGGGRGEALSRARQSAPMAPPPPPMMQPQRPAAEEPIAGADSRASALGALVREDFPATLFFVGEVALDARGQARVEVPLADALTTYRLEAIAWSASGWTTSAMSRLRVDQAALVDAPIPPYATAGDVLRLPVRVENRGEDALPVRIEVRAEGNLTIDTPAPVSLEIPGRESRESIVLITLRSAGEGSLIVSASRPGGEGLDAVRRPMRVLADARTARERRLELIDQSGTISIEIPAEASERGPGQITLAVGARLFGDVAERTGDPLWAGWALSMASEPLPDSVATSVLEWVDYDDDDTERLNPPLQSALALASTWGDPRLTDADAARALRSVGQYLPAPEVMRDQPEGLPHIQADWLLIALAPMTSRLDGRPALRQDAERLLGQLRRVVSTVGARATDAPSTWARAAAALALSGGEHARAEEMVRRVERHVVRVGSMAWVESDEYDEHGSPERRAQPTALTSLALSALGRRAEAMPFVRSLLEMRQAPSEGARDILPRPSFEGVDIALASAAAARLGARSTGDARVTLDGRPVELTEQGGASVGSLEGLGRPGARSLVVQLSAGAVALAHVSLAYGMPWTTPPRRAAPIELAIDGEIGARDTRSGVLLRVQNRGARILTRPVVELELPAGAELDEPTREALGRHLRAPARQEGRTLVLPLRTLAPGGWVRVPIPARWALGGTLRGLGAVAYDEVGPEHAPIVPVAVLPSRAVDIPDEGPEPERPDAESSPPERLPPPLPLLERLSPGGPR